MAGVQETKRKARSKALMIIFIVTYLAPFGEGLHVLQQRFSTILHSFGRRNLEKTKEEGYSMLYFLLEVTIIDFIGI
jgi:hypothetical protein